MKARCSIFTWLLAAGLFVVLQLGVLFVYGQQPLKAVYSIGDPAYLHIFTKLKHQVWTRLIPNGGWTEDDIFIRGFKPKPRHFGCTEFWNGSMYIFGGSDKDMLFNDVWSYAIPTFASARSKWYELARLYERSVDWLKFHNNRYNHEILKDVYERVCKDSFDSEAMVSRGRTWEMGTQGEVSHPTGLYHPKTENLQPIAGGNPLDVGGLELGEPQQAWEPLTSLWPEQGWVEKGKWVCEELQMRYDFINYQTVRLRQDFTRPSPRYASAMRLVYRLLLPRKYSIFSNKCSIFSNKSNLGHATRLQ